MELSTFAFHAGTGWSLDTFPSLDSPDTLVLVFGAPGFIDAPAPIQTLIDAYPLAKIVGCSGAGEIHGEHIEDGSLSVAILRFAKTRLRVAETAVGSGIPSESAGTRSPDRSRAPTCAPSSCSPTGSRSTARSS